MKAFLILAHGSRKAQSNEEVQKLADCFGIQNQSRYPIVMSAFMELAQPDIPTVVNEAINSGATELIILPYFLAAGAHVVDDIPSIVADCLAEHPNIAYTILPHIGGAKGMVELIQKVAEDESNSG